jgi:hypothetical protein
MPGSRGLPAGIAPPPFKRRTLPLWPCFPAQTRPAQDAAYTRFCTRHITSKLTGVSPMPCIGKMEPFQPSRTGWNGGETPHNGVKTGTRPRRFVFSSCPGYGIRDRTLGPASENPGRWYPAGAPKTRCRKWPRSHPDTSVSKPPKLQKVNRTYTKGCTALIRLNTLCERQKPSILCKCKTQKPAASLLRDNLWLC